MKPDNEAGKVTPQAITNAAIGVLDEIVRTDKGTQTARCNEGVNMMYEKLTGNRDLSGKRANAIVDYWANSDDWQEIDIRDAQELANQGHIVVAGAKAGPSETSGHVVVIVPGKQQEGSWGWVPMAMDTGKNKRWTSKRISESWKKDREKDVKFYLYTGPIKK